MRKLISFVFIGLLIPLISSGAGGYLIKNKGASIDFHLIKDIVDKHTQTIETQIENTVSPTTSVTGGFPWQPEDEVIEGSSGPAAAAAESVMDVTPTPPV